MTVVFDGRPFELEDSGPVEVLFASRRGRNAADDDIDGLTRLVAQAGGSVTGTVGLTQEFVDANSAEKMLSLVNSPIEPAGAQLSTASVDQGSKAGDLLGSILGGGAGQGGGGNPLNDLLGGMLGGGQQAGAGQGGGSILDMLGGLLGGGRR